MTDTKNKKSCLYDVWGCSGDNSSWVVVPTFKSRDEAKVYCDRLNGGCSTEDDQPQRPNIADTFMKEASKLLGDYRRNEESITDHYEKSRQKIDEYELALRKKIDDYEDSRRKKLRKEGLYVVVIKTDEGFWKAAAAFNNMEKAWAYKEEYEHKSGKNADFARVDFVMPTYD